MAIFNDAEQGLIRKAIEEVEKHTDGEIRVCVEKECSEDVLLRTAKYFEQLGMQKTAKRHGVLIYLATTDRKFAIIGDKGINELVPENFWDTTKNAMLVQFKTGNLIDGIVAGIKIAGEELRKSFPCADNNNPHELPNDVAFMDGD